MAGPPRKREPPVLNPPRHNEALRDLEDPTHAFPIRRHEQKAVRKRVTLGSDDEQFLGDPLDSLGAVTAEDEDEDDFPELPPRRPSVDARLVVLWLAVASLLAILAGLAAAAAVVYL